MNCQKLKKCFLETFRLKFEDDKKYGIDWSKDKLTTVGVWHDELAYRQRRFGIYGVVTLERLDPEGVYIRANNIRYSSINIGSVVDMPICYLYKEDNFNLKHFLAEVREELKELVLTYIGDKDEPTNFSI